MWFGVIPLYMQKNQTSPLWDPDSYSHILRVGKDNWRQMHVSTYVQVLPFPNRLNTDECISQLALLRDSTVPVTSHWENSSDLLQLTYPVRVTRNQHNWKIKEGEREVASNWTGKLLSKLAKKELSHLIIGCLTWKDVWL